MTLAETRSKDATPAHGPAHGNGALPIGATVSGAAPMTVRVDGHEIRLPPSLAHLADPSVLEQARRRVEETTESQDKIAKSLGVSPSQLNRFVVAAGWTRPEDAPKPPLLDDGGPPRRRRPASARAVMRRLVCAVDRQIDMIEARLKDPRAEIEERDARILGALAKTLQTLMALDRDDGAKSHAPEPVDRDELNAGLARRIARWAESRAGSE